MNYPQFMQMHQPRNNIPVEQTTHTQNKKIKKVIKCFDNCLVKKGLKKKKKVL